MKFLPSRLFLLLGAPLLLACPQKKAEPAADRCEVDWASSGHFSLEGSGAKARRIDSAEDLIGGTMPTGVLGDTLLSNDQVRVVIQKPGRHLGPVLFGGNIVDADLQRAPGEAGRDQFGKVGLFHSFGRAVNVTAVEVLSDGSNGGPAVVAATGKDALIDIAYIDSFIAKAGETFQPVVSPETPQPLKMTTYYVLSPGESRIRMLTAVCNEGDKPVLTAVGDLVEQGGVTDFFNPTSCSNDVGDNDCLVDTAPWFGFQAKGVAYGYSTQSLDDLSRPELGNALFGTQYIPVVAGGKGMQEMLGWVDKDAQNRPGTFVVRPSGQKLFLRDFWITPSLGELTTLMTRREKGEHGTLRVRVTQPDGDTPVADARVAVDQAGGSHLATMLVTDAQGRAEVELPVGKYSVRSILRDRTVPAAVDVSVEPGSGQEISLKTGIARRLRVRITDPFAAPSPGKVTVQCVGPCATPRSAWRHLHSLERLPTDVMQMVNVPPEGLVDIALPPGKYSIVVTRGPEFSAWPDTWPGLGAPVDLTERDAELSATLARAVDSDGWMSADLHVHSVNSPDSSVSNEDRVLSYLAEGVDILTSTDHEVVTDFAPYVEALHAKALLTPIIGQEISPPFGHQNIFPIVRKPTPTGGSFDWGNNGGPTLRFPQMWELIRQEHPDALIQINHPRGGAGTIGSTKWDTLTGKSLLAPETYRMAPDPLATPDDTRMFGTGFDVYEVMNGQNPTFDTMNDWMTLLSRGVVKTASATSDTHSLESSPGGYGRTFLQVGVDTPEQLTTSAFVQALKAHKAVGTNGPMLKVTARRRDATGVPVGDAVGLGETLSIQASTGETVELTVDVQTPAWMAFDSIELYTHALGRDARGGQENGTWPAERILQKKSYTAAALPIEAVPGTGGLNVQRHHVVEHFTVTPTHDTWFVVMVRSSTLVPTLFPVSLRGVKCDSTGCRPNSPRPFAFSNPILVDADGSGAYDDFPLRVMQGLTRAPAVTEPAPRPVAGKPSPEAWEAFWERVREKE
jgi:hypothetical protein